MYRRLPTREEWQAVRAEWAAGVLSTRALAAKWGISEKAIRLRASDPRQEGGPWQRDPDASARKRMTLRRLRASPEGAALLRARARERERVEIMRRVADEPETRQVLRDLVIEQAAESLAQANIAHLQRLKDLGSLIDRYLQLLHAFLAPAEDEAARERAAQAGATLLAGRRDDIARHLRTLAVVLESLQVQTLRALGLDRVLTPRPFGPGGSHG